MGRAVRRAPALRAAAERDCIAITGNAALRGPDWPAMHHPPPPAARSALDALADAALHVIDELTPGDLLAAITPERLGDRSGYAPSSVRYQLSRAPREPVPRAATGAVAGADPLPIVARKRWAFDREHVLLIALAAAGEHSRANVVEAVSRYLDALTQAEQNKDLGPLAAAIQADLDASTPGATEQASAMTSARVRSIAVAAADGSPEIARELRAEQSARLDLYDPVYERALAITGRVLREGVSLRDLASHVSLLLEGVAQRRRFEPAVDERLVLDAVLAIFKGLTRPAG